MLAAGPNATSFGPAKKGSGTDCSQTMPCATLNEAFNTNRAVVKVNGTTAVPLTGKITIDAKRDAQKSAVVIKIEGGKGKYETTVEP